MKISLFKSNIFKSCLSMIVASTIMAFSTQVSAAPSLKIAYFGDSTTNGGRAIDYNQSLSQDCIYTPGGGPIPLTYDYSPVNEYIKERVPLASVVRNYGVDGRTAQQQATTYLIEFEERLISDNYGMVILNYGINDARYARSKEDYVKNMKALVDAATRHGAFVVIEKPNPIKECVSSKPGSPPAAPPRDVLESYRAELDSLAGPNVAFVDHGVWNANPYWYTLMADTLHPNDWGYRSKAVRVADKINSLQWCGVSSNRTFVGPNDTYSYHLTHTQQTAFKAYWHGTRNGVTDLNGVEVATLIEPGQINLGTYTNQPSYVGTYTRWVVIKDNANNVICTTPAIKQQITATSACPLIMIPEVVPPLGAYKYVYQGPTGTYGWNGTNADGNDKVTVSNTLPQEYNYINQPGWAGTYERYLKPDYPQGCTSNTVSTELK